MLAGYSVLALVPARSGSKGIANKNLVDVVGKPLIAWTIEAAVTSTISDRIIVSTDSLEIANIGKKYGAEVPFLRPAYLATDFASSLDVIQHTISNVPGYEIVVLLQPTSPLRKGFHIDEAIRLLVNSGADSCISVTEAVNKPHWMYSRSPDGYICKSFPSLTKVERRQDAGEYFVPNGAIYAIWTERLKKYGDEVFRSPISYEMTRQSSVDIDDEYDLAIARMMLADGC